MKDSVLDVVHESAQGLHRAGVINDITMREYDALCLPEVHQLSAQEIKKIRRHARVSQPVFAKFLNISASTVKQWELGTKHPSPACLKLLDLVARKGIMTLA